MRPGNVHNPWVHAARTPLKRSLLAVRKLEIVVSGRVVDALDDAHLHVCEGSELLRRILVVRLLDLLDKLRQVERLELRKAAVS